MSTAYPLKPSRLMLVALAVMHGLAVLATAISGLPLWARAAIFLLVVLNFMHQWYSRWSSSNPSLVEGMALAQGQATLYCRDGRTVGGLVLGSSMVTPFLCVINILPTGQRVARSVIVLADAMDAETYRRLRVQLRWEGQSGSQLGGVSTVGAASASVYG